MSPTISQQHPAVVLRSRYSLVRTMLAVAMAAVVSLAIAVTVLAIDASDDPVASTATPTVLTIEPSAGTTRFDGGPEEGTRGAVVVAEPTTPTRFDGGPEEGTAGR